MVCSSAKCIFVRRHMPWALPEGTVRSSTHRTRIPERRASPARDHSTAVEWQVGVHAAAHVNVQQYRQVAADDAERAARIRRHPATLHCRFTKKNVMTKIH